MNTPAPRGRWLGTTLKLAFLGSVVALFGFAMLQIQQAGASGMAVIDAWAASVRSGAPVSEALAGSEREQVASVVKASTGTSYVNFLAQAGTACFEVKLDDPSRTRLSILLVEQGDRSTVAAVGIQRECECPDDTEPCHLP